VTHVTHLDQVAATLAVFTGAAHITGERSRCLHGAQYAPTATELPSTWS
jgi:hypothetical protein